MLDINKKFPQRDVWAASVAAQHINGIYINRTVKSSFYTNFSKNIYYQNIKKDNGLYESNVSIMASLLFTSKLSNTDYKIGQTIRKYFTSWLSRILEGNETTFIKLVIKAVNLNFIQIASSSFPIIASLPSSYLRNIHQDKIKNILYNLEINSSPLLGDFKTVYHKKIIIIDCIFKKYIYFTPYEIHAIIKNDNGFDSVIYFCHANEWEINKSYEVSLIIKQKNIKTTQVTVLNSPFSIIN